MTEAQYALFGVFIGAALTCIWDILKSFLNKGKEAHYLAVRLVPVLEQFLDGCYDVASDDGTYHGQPAGNDGTYSPQVKIPELILPDDVEWKSIDKDLVEEIMKLPVKLYSINKSLSIDAEFAEPDYSDYMSSRQLQFSKFSLELDCIISRLKKKILKQKPTVYSGYWNPREWCQTFISDYEVRMKALEGKR